MTVRNKDENGFSTCLENARLAEMLQNQVGDQGVGALYTKLLKNTGHQDVKPSTPELTPWWRGARGEWYVVIQVALGTLVFLGPRTWLGWPAMAFPFPRSATVLGIGLLATGLLLVVASAFRLGKNLTPVPFPKAKGTLIESGPYRIVRHPMYSGGILIAFGWALFSQGWLTLGYSALLALLFDVKSRHEEKWLTAKYPGYADYQRRVRKLVPFLY